MAIYEYVLTDLAGVVFGELTNADERTLTLSHLRVPTATATIPMWHNRAKDVIVNDCLLKVYRQTNIAATKRLVFNGPVVGLSENAEAEVQSLQINAAGPFWRWTKRLIPASLLYDGATGKSPGVSFFAADLGSIAQQLLTDTNAVSFTGVSVGTRTNSISGGYGPITGKVLSDAVAELSTGLGSFEYEFVPTEPTSVGGTGGWPQIALFNVAPTIGTTKLDAIFEWGTPTANVESYTRTISYDGLLTRGWMTVDGWPDTPTAGHTITYQDATSQITSRGLFEELMDAGGIIDDTLRANVINYNLAVRKNPRQLITFKPAINRRPYLFDDYSVADIVRARAEQHGTVRFDGSFRVWGATVTVDTNGNESVELELVVP